jgi:glycerol-3-phosphate cytidylyltransferase-like family protein
LNLLRRAAEIGEVWVALNTDEFAERYKRRPIMTYSERLQSLLACRYVHFVVKNEAGEDSRPAIDLVKPMFIVHGDDWTGDSLYKQLGITKEWLLERDIELLYLPYTKTISTSELIDRIRSSDEPRKPLRVETYPGGSAVSDPDPGRDYSHSLRNVTWRNYSSF